MDTCYVQAGVLTPVDINSISMEVLRVQALEYMSSDEAAPALVPYLTFALLERLFEIVWRWSPEQRMGWSKQRALAKVAACITGGRVPAWADAERPGQLMQESLRRFRERRKKVVDAERKATRRLVPGKPRPVAAADLATRIHQEEEALYHCRYGCTPASLPTRRVPPGKRPQQVEYVTTSMAAECQRLHDENLELQRLETTVVQQLTASLDASKKDLQNSVSSEYAAIKEIDRQSAEKIKVEAEAHAQARKLEIQCTQMKLSKNSLQQTVQKQEGHILKLSGQIASCWNDFERARETYHKDSQRHQKTVIAAREESMLKQAELERLREQWSREAKLQEETMKKNEAKLLRQGSIITQLNMDLALKQQTHEKEMEAMAKRKACLEAEFEACSSKLKRARELKNEMAKRRRLSDLRAATSERRLERAQIAESNAADLREDMDALHAYIDEHLAVDNRMMSVSDDMEPSIFTNQRHSGKFAAFHWKLRLLIYSWLMRRTPPSAIGLNLVDAARLLAPAQTVVVPTVGWIRKMRQEGTLLGELLSCFRVAKAKRVISFGFDETTKLGDGLASTNVQIEHASGHVSDEVMRGAFLIPGGTAEQVASAMETKLFARGRRLLCKWQQVHEDLFGVDSWGKDGGPKSSQLGYHRLVGSLIMSDTCNAARAAKRRIIELASEDVEKLAGPQLWSQLSDAQKETAGRAYTGDCMQHLRNILLDAMAKSAQLLLTDELEESLSAFSSYDRMTTDPMQLIRAV